VMLQLNPPLWVMTPLGEGMWVLCYEPGLEHNKIATVFLQDGNILDFDLKDLRGTENPTFGRAVPQPPKPHYP